MYPTIFLIHKYSAMIFVLIYLIKTILLLTNKNELLADITKKIKVPEMIISFTFLATGIYLAIYYPFIGTFFYIKMACVFASIPLAIIGFKKGNKILATLSLVLLFGAYGIAEMNKNRASKNLVIDTPASEDQLVLGKAVYEKGCQMCHGADGAGAIAGSANLKLTQMTADDQKSIIKNGKNSMPKFSNLTDQQLNAVVAYIGTLK